MANFNLVIDTSNFKPFSYKDIMAPYEDYARDYDTRKAEIENYIDTYGNLILPLGSKASLIYNKYLEDLNNALEQYYELGLTPLILKNLEKIFRTNKATISRIKKSADAYYDYKNKYRQLGNDAIYDDLDFDSFMENGNTLPKYINRKEVIAGSSVYFKGVLQAYEEDAEFKEVLKDLYLQQSWKGSITSQDLIKGALTTYAQYNPESASKVQLHIQDYFNKIDTSGMSYESKSKVWDAITEGLIDSITNSKNIVTDRNPELKTTAYARKLTELAAKAVEQEKINAANLQHISSGEANIRNTLYIYTDSTGKLISVLSESDVPNNYSYYKQWDEWNTSKGQYVTKTSSPTTKKQLEGKKRNPDQIPGNKTQTQNKGQKQDQSQGGSGNNGTLDGNGLRSK